ncbi:MAG: YitT family protein [Clostridia bacterium]
MINKLTKNHACRHGVKILLAIAGTFFYAFGINVFITGLGLYSGGIMGLCQLIRTAIVHFFPAVHGFDLAGLIYYIVNIPIFIVAYKSIGKMFFFRTLICVTTISLFMAVIPVPMELLVSDTLVACIIGGIISGFGTGLTLKMGSSAGGMDIVGIYCIQHNLHLSVGNISLIINVLLYGICMIVFNVETAIYSILFAVISSVALDRTYSQSINVEVTIITKSTEGAIEAAINKGLARGVTTWQGCGAYTQQETRVLYVVLSKFEVAELKHIVHSIDPNAFIVVKEGVKIDGNYLKKLV